MPKQFQTASKDTKVVYLIPKNRNDFFYETLAPNPHPATPPRPAFGATPRMRRASRSGLGQAACDGKLCLHPFALQALSVSRIDYGRDGKARLQA